MFLLFYMYEDVLFFKNAKMLPEGVICLKLYYNIFL